MTKTNNIIDRERTKAIIFLSKNIKLDEDTTSVKPLCGLHGSILNYFRLDLDAGIESLDNHYEMVITESVYPGGFHQVVVRNDRFSAFFKSKHRLPKGSVNCSEYVLHFAETQSEQLKIPKHNVDSVIKEKFIRAMKDHIGMETTIKILMD